MDEEFLRKQNKIFSEHNNTNIKRAITEEMKSHISTYEEFPFRILDWKYYLVRRKEDEYPQVQREKNGVEETLIDFNDVAGESTSFIYANLCISEDEEKFGFLFNKEGTDGLKLQVRSMNGEILFEKEKVRDFQFFKEELVYVGIDKRYRPSKVYRTNFKENKLLYEEDDEQCFVFLSKSSDSKELYINSWSLDYTETRIYDGNMSLFEEKRSEHSYTLDKNASRRIVKSNKHNKNFEIFLIKDEWEKILEPEKGTIEDIIVLEDYLIAVERYVSTTLRTYNFNTGKQNKIHLSDTGYEIQDVIQEKEQRNTVYVKITSPTTSETTYKVTLETLEYEEAHSVDIANYNEEDYEHTQTFIKEIPVTLLSKKKTDTKKLLLTGYGFYGVPFKPRFRKELIPLLDRGYTYAIAHVRGGGDKGKDWHDQAKRLTKKQTFKDFETVSRHLIEQGYTDKENLVLHGKSAGGTLVSVAINNNPELYRACVSLVPFVDVIGETIDEDAPLSKEGWLELGNPNKEDVYEYIESYSPLNNIKRQKYPDTLITVSANDTRVPSRGPINYFKEILEKSTNKNIFLKTNFEGGHSGYTSETKHIEEKAEEYAFIIESVDSSK